MAYPHHFKQLFQLLPFLFRQLKITVLLFAQFGDIIAIVSEGSEERYSLCVNS